MQGSAAPVAVPGLTIFGITGRMGQTLLRALREGDRGRAASISRQEGTATPIGGPLRLCGAVASPDSGRLGTDAAVEGAPTGILVTADPRLGLADAAVAIDFSLPQCVAMHARACTEAKVPLLVGTTGFDAVVRESLATAAAVIPVLVAPNTSVGVNVMASLVRLATRALGTDYDVEIGEVHHRMKRDAPSGTALALGEVVAQARGRQLNEIAVFSRQGNAPRSRGDIGFAVGRAGDIVGEHTVTFAADGERLEITHRASDRITFARGALLAAHWLTGKRPGLYSMAEALGLPPVP